MDELKEMKKLGMKFVRVIAEKEAPSWLELETSKKIIEFCLFVANLESSASQQ